MKTTLKTLSMTFLAAGGILLVACGGSESKQPPSAQNSPSAPVEAPVAARPTQAPAEPQAKVEAPRTKVDPCTLLTKAEAAAALGEPMKDGEYPKKVVNDPLGISSCFFSAVAPTSISMADVQVIQNGTMDEKVRKQGMNAKKIFEEAKRLTDGPVKPVSGVGDEAFLDGMGIRVLKGDTHLHITMMRRGMPSATPETDAALMAMARAAVERLGR
jgi:hypothetical protein